MDIKQARKNVIEQQIRPWGGLNVRANQALSDIPRENFVPEEYLSLVFADIEVPLIDGAKMFSPKIEGRILDSLDIQGHETVLEIGTGSGSLTSFLAGIVKPRGHVYTYDVEPKFMKIAEKNIKKAGMSKYITMSEFDFKKAKSYHIQKLI